MKFLTLILCCCGVLLGQRLDLVRAAAVARPGGNAMTQELRDFGNGVRGLQCNCIFKPSAESRRASWDIPMKLDLSQCAGLKLILCCSNMENISHYTVHIRAGSSWFSANFEMSGDGRWQEIFIPKSSFFREDSRECSWQNCNTLRLAIWKGAAGRASLNVMNVEFVQPNVNIALLRPMANGRNCEQSALLAERLNSALVMYGIMPAVIDDNEMTYSALHLYDILLVALPEALNNEQTEILIGCMQHGSKAALFYQLSPRLAAQMGTPLGKCRKIKEEEERLAWIVADSRLLPGVKPVGNCTDAYISVEALPKSCRVLARCANQSNRLLRQPALIETAQGFWMTHAYLNQNPLDGGNLLYAALSRFMPELRQTGARTVYASFDRWAKAQTAAQQQAMQPIAAQIQSAWSRGDFSGCIALCHEARQNFTAARAGSRQRKRGELRGAGSLRSAGFGGYSWEEGADILERRGMNAVFPLVASPYATAYQSRIVANCQNNGLAECVEACHNHGIAVHAWINCLDVSGASERQLRQWQQSGQLQVDEAGNTLKWLCPNNPLNRLLLSRLAAEVAMRSDVYGIHFGKICYPGEGCCHCVSCRAAFEAFAKTGPLSWSEGLQHPDLQKKWQAFRIASINALLAEMINGVNTSRKGILISAAVSPDLVTAREKAGQDWGSWIKQRWLSFVMPLNYCKSPALFAQNMQRELQQAGDASRVVPGICINGDQAVKPYIDLLCNTGVPGYIIFE